MDKAVFFDWFNTLARYEPSREELHQRACIEFGVNLTIDQVRAGTALADKYWYKENSQSPVANRSPADQMAVGLRYQEIVLSSAGISLPRELMQRVSQRAQQLFKEMRFVLFEDVLSTLKTLKRYKLIIGLLTNAPKNILSNLKLGHEPFIDFVVTSEEAGADKPHPSIFLMALERAKVGSSQAIYVGDQYEVDIVGAHGVGLRAVLLDRYDLFANIECPRIRQLPEVIKLLDI